MNRHSSRYLPVYEAKRIMVKKRNEGWQVNMKINKDGKYKLYWWKGKKLK